VLDVAAGQGWEEWSRVSDFADSSGTDLHYVLDERAGEVMFGPAVRQSDGSMSQFGAIPPKGAVLRIRSYRTGGGYRGNVSKGALNVLKSTIPYVSSVENRLPASGGVDGETIEEAKVRGPIVMRTLNRGVTSLDYEHLTRQAAPEVARVRCVAALQIGDQPNPGGAVRVLIVPSCAGDERGRLRFEQLVPEDETLERVTRYLDERRVVATRLVVEPPTYQGVTVVAQVRARARARMTTVEEAGIRALYEYYHPIIGGPDGTGWPFGRPIHVGEVYAVLQRVEGVEYIEQARLYGTDPITGRRGDPVERLEIDSNSLVFSYEHLIRVG
jgi:predicted phage baseplate assembly protein